MESSLNLLLCASPQSGNDFIERITAANYRGIIKPVIPAPPLEREAGGRERVSGCASQMDTGTHRSPKGSEEQPPQAVRLLSSVHFSSRRLETVCSLMEVGILLYV